MCYNRNQHHMTYQTWLYEKNYVIDEIKRYAEVILLSLEKLLMFVSNSICAHKIVEVGDLARNCLLDPNCINRLHPAILMTARANPGDSIIFYSRNCDDIDLAPTAPRIPEETIRNGVQFIHLRALYISKELILVTC